MTSGGNVSDTTHRVNTNTGFASLFTDMIHHPTLLCRRLCSSCVLARCAERFTCVPMNALEVFVQHYD